jgi:hypothetical protein
MTINFTMSNEEYHLSPALSASGAKTIALKSLAHYKYAERKESTVRPWHRRPYADAGTAPIQDGLVWTGDAPRQGLD